MFGSIYIGLSGLNAYSRGLQLISNNVANLNTSGFKGTNVSFQNFYGSGDGGGLSFLGSNGNGHGVGIKDSGLNFAQGELRQTDNGLDLAVDGNGFLTLLDGERTLYVRTGSFEVAPDGHIVLSGTGYRLATLDASGKPVSLSIDGYRTNAPKATNTIKLNQNVWADTNASMPADSLPMATLGNLTVHDATGAAHVWTLKMERLATPDTEPTGTILWRVSVTEGGNAVGGTTEKTVKFLSGFASPGNEKVAIADAASGLNVTLDFSSVTSFSGTSSLASSSIDGYGAGSLSTIAVNGSGKLELGYTNDQKADLGAVAIAAFRDTDSLEQRDGGLFVQKDGSAHEFLASDDARVGQVLSKRLEASNVDLSGEFGEMIMIQRGFQASSQIVSVSNDMIQQLFGMRGQG